MMGTIDSAKIATVLSFLQLGVNIAKQVGIPAKDLYLFLTAKATDSGDTEQLKKDLADWIAMRASHEAEANRPLPLE
jgi:hypothetical protein